MVLVAMVSVLVNFLGGGGGCALRGKTPGKHFGKGRKNSYCEDVLRCFCWTRELCACSLESFESEK